jgi:hypothetical protein
MDGMQCGRHSLVFFIVNLFILRHLRFTRFAFVVSIGIQDDGEHGFSGWPSPGELSLATFSRREKDLRQRCMMSRNCPYSLPISITRSLGTAGMTKILPSPILPVRATSTMRRVISSTRASSTQRLISTFGRNACEYSLPAY